MKLTQKYVWLFALLLAPAAFAQRQQQQPAGPAAPAAATDCFATFTGGSGATAFTFCVTMNGNVLRLESPAGREHIRNGVFMEGYAICEHTSPYRRYWDLGAYSPGSLFLAPTIVQPNGPNTLPLTITRKTWDNGYTLKQTFARNVQDKSVTVTMSLTNGDITWYGPNRDVSLWRAADFDMNGSFSNWGGSTEDSAFAWNNVWSGSPTGNGGMLKTLSYATPHTAGTTSYGAGDPACPEFRDTGWPRTDDVVTWVGHHYTYTGVNQTKTAVVQLRVF